MAKKYTQNFCDYFASIFMKGGSFSYLITNKKREVDKMKINEYEYYNKLANWSFNDIDYTSVNFTNWIYEDEIIKHSNKQSTILDLGTAAGEKVLKYFPDCKEILGTDFSKEMIKNANKNLERSGRKNISFRVMNNLEMNTPDNYFDLVTARHTVIDAKQIYRTLKQEGYLLIRGVDKLDCWELKRMFNRGQAFHNKKPISVIDYEAILNAGFKNVELIPLHIIEYYKTQEDLCALLLKVPILYDIAELEENKRVPIDKNIFEKYVYQNTTKKGIKLIRRYYGIIAQKNN